MKKLTLPLVLLFVMLPLFGSSAQSPLITRVCLVTDIGRVNDGTFNQYAYEGMQRAVEDFDLESTAIETRTSDDYSANVEACINDGYDAVITVGFMLGDITHAAALANPDVDFIGVDQFFADPLPNLVGIQFREDQAGFIVGAMAALMTHSGTIAGVYGSPIPPVLRYRNGYEQGARYMNPDLTILGIHIDNFNAPARGATAAEEFVRQGADVIFGAGGVTGSGAITRAAQEEVYVIGVDQDEYFSTFGGGTTPGAEYLMTSAVKRVDVGVYNMLAALVTGSDFPTNSLYILEVLNEGINFSESHDAHVPDGVAMRVREVLEGLYDGMITTGVDPVSGLLLSDIPPTPAPTATPRS